MTWIWPETAIIIAVTLLLAIVGRWLLVRAIRKVVATSIEKAQKREAQRPGKPRLGPPAERHKQRTATMGSLLTNVITILISVIAILTIMSTLGLPLGPLVASAGIGGVALGFGAQSLVKDYISGLFMIAEDQYGVGDFIDTGEAQGTVEEVTLRVTRLRALDGVIWYVRNGEIIRVANQSQGWSTAMVDIPVAPDADSVRALNILRQAMKDLVAERTLAAQLLDEPTVLGVESLSGTAMTLRVMAKCRPNEHWGVQREIRDYGKRALVAAGIKGPLAIELPPQV